MLVARDERLWRAAPQLHVERYLTLVANTPSFTGILSSRFAESFSRSSPTVGCAPVQRSDHVACLHAGFFRGRTGVDVANEYPSPSGAPKNAPSCPLMSSASMRDGAARREHAAVPFHRGICGISASEKRKFRASASSSSCVTPCSICRSVALIV